MLLLLLEMQRIEQIRKMFVKKNLENLIPDWTKIGEGGGRTNRLFLGFQLVCWVRWWCLLLSWGALDEGKQEKEDGFSLKYRIDYIN